MEKETNNFIEDKNIEEVLKYIFPDVDDWVHNKTIPNLIVDGKKVNSRPAYRSEKLKLIIQFENSGTYISLLRMDQQEENEYIYKKAGYRVVTIPYGIEVSKLKEAFDKKKYTYNKDTGLNKEAYKNNYNNKVENKSKIIDKNIYESNFKDNNMKIKDTIANIPGIPMTTKERAIKLLEYEDMELSKQEEEKFYITESASYTVRMDADINYNNKMYYKKFYISKDVIITERKETGTFNQFGVYITPDELRSMGKSGLVSVEVKEKGIFKEYEDGTTIIHWSSPIANLYYENEKNKNNQMKINDYIYNTMLIRNFEFRPLKFYNKYIADNEFYKNGTIDEFLIKVLLDKKNSNELTDIIFTIQSNQNKIIRTYSNENFIVQGCAGSGKTMILLHRLSYLKFNNKLPSYDEIKIITPNQLFNNFIEKLTKDLSIQHIEQITIANYYLRLNNLYIERYNKIEEIDEKFYRRYKERFKNEFGINKVYNEREYLNEKILNMYSPQMVEFIKKEYTNLIESINEDLKDNDLEIENQYLSNQIYYGQVIKNITKKINELAFGKGSIKLSDSNVDIAEICSNIEKKLNGIDDLLKNLNQKFIDNNEIIDKTTKNCNELEKEIDKKEKVFKRKMNNISTNSTNYKVRDLANKINQRLQLRQAQMIESGKICSNLKNEITNFNNSLNELLKEKMENKQKIEEILEKCNYLKEKRDIEIKTEKIFFKKTRNLSIVRQYYKDLHIENEKIKTLNSRQFKILDEEREKKQKIDELNQKLREYKLANKVSEKQRRISQQNMDNYFKHYNKILKLEYEKIQNLNTNQFEIIEKIDEKTKEKEQLIQKIERINKFQELKMNIINNVYFTIDIYKNIIEKVRDKFCCSISQNSYSKIDLLICLYINYLHIGELINSDKLLCIDEVQDYNEIEIEILKKVNKNVVINLYGDVNQAIYKNGIYNWDNLKKSLNLKEYVLNENYRNSIEITKYCNEKFNYNILEMGLSIKSVETIEESQIMDIINEKIKQGKTIAVISKNETIEKIDSKFVSYCNIQDIKGIEYNTVIVDDRNMSQNEKYIAYTRALGELYILNF